ncbi:MAG: SIS domain-containing protein, partial [Verrucomicrobiota bacterium]
MDHLARAKEVFDVEVAAIQGVCNQLDAAFERAVECILQALSSKNKVVVVGIGKSGNIGQKIAATFTSTGSTAVLLHSVDALHGDLGIVNEGDVVLALSYSGETEELLTLLPALKRCNVKMISFTASPKSTLGRHSDII